MQEKLENVFFTTYPPHHHIVFERPPTEDDRFKAVAAKATI